MMMEKLRKLSKRSRLHSGEDGEASGSARNTRLRWYHKAIVVPVFALAVFGAVSVATPDEALAHEGTWVPVYGQPNPDTGGYNSYCWYDHVHIFNTSFWSQHERGCEEIDISYWGSGLWVWVPYGYSWPTYYLWYDGYWYPV